MGGEREGRRVRERTKRARQEKKRVKGKRVGLYKNGKLEERKTRN